MKQPLRSALLVAAIACLASPCLDLRAQNPSNATSLPAGQVSELQGSWQGVEIGRENEGKCTLTIAGDTIEFHGANKQEWYKATFTLPSGTEPKQLRGLITACPAPDIVGKTSVAIYKVENGTLTLTGKKPGIGEAPTAFADLPDTRTFVLQKAKPE